MNKIKNVRKSVVFGLLNIHVYESLMNFILLRQLGKDSLRNLIWNWAMKKWVGKSLLMKRRKSDPGRGSIMCKGSGMVNVRGEAHADPAGSNKEHRHWNEPGRKGGRESCSLKDHVKEPSLPENHRILQETSNVAYWKKTQSSPWTPFLLLIPYFSVNGVIHPGSQTETWRLLSSTAFNWSLVSLFYFLYMPQIYTLSLLFNSDLIIFPWFPLHN